MARKLAPAIQIVHKISQKYCPCLYLSIDQIWWVNEFCGSKDIFKNPLSCTTTYQDVTDLVNHDMVKNTKTWISRERNITFLWNEKILNLCLRWHILRSYRLVADVNFHQFKINYCSSSIKRFSLSLPIPCYWSLSTTPKNIRKLDLFWCFREI